MAQEEDTDLDATLLAAIEEWRGAWSEVRSLDDEDPRLDAAARKAIRLERKIAKMPAMSEAGYRAKIEVICAAQLDEDLLLAIMFLLGRDAERLGIADAPPDLRADL
ncbi:hypothetical protein [Bradyrhizobium sp. SZCCHNR3118]|uniref:hypothetical protein n=1 Tax=Bradyrhizobium sp. SZCCHNR3118 TaxID=3057468 RepID=UPI002915D68E|nr:hypothetical protein [Bradyrhizobium sp. SZCCHNR3118]